MRVMIFTTQNWSLIIGKMLYFLVIKLMINIFRLLSFIDNFRCVTMSMAHKKQLVKLLTAVHIESFHERWKSTAYNFLYY